MSLLRWMAPRRTTLITIAAGSLSWVVAFALAWRLWPAGPVLLTTADRLGYALQLLVGVAVLVLLMVSTCFRVFDTPGAVNPLADAESAAWKLHQRVLQNTVEQSVIFIPALLALAVRIEPARTGALAVLTALWCAGRVLFWVGYRITPTLRGPGFEWTLFTSVATLVWFASTL